MPLQFTVSVLRSFVLYRNFSPYCYFSISFQYVRKKKGSWNFLSSLTGCSICKVLGFWLIFFFFNLLGWKEASFIWNPLSYIYFHSQFCWTWIQIWDPKALYEKGLSLIQCFSLLRWIGRGSWKWLVLFVLVEKEAWEGVTFFLEYVYFHFVA